MSIKIKNLYKNYKGFEAVKNLNFEIKKGSITGLLGPNGCGKTTTIGMILGLIRPTKGEVLINNKDIEIEKNRINVLEKNELYISLCRTSKKTISQRKLNCLWQNV